MNYDQTCMEWIDQYRGKMGLYALYRYDVCLYVGKADCLCQRLRTHFKRRKDLTECRIYDLQSEMKGLSYDGTKAYLSWREALLIGQLNPLENIKRPKLSWEILHRMPIDAQSLIINGIPNLEAVDSP